MRIGAHVSTAKSLDLAIDRAVELGAETIQIFGSQPQRWALRNYPAEVIEAFRTKAAAHDVRPVFLHGIYLINLASENPENLRRSIDSLIFDMRLAAQLGAEGVIFHVGSHRGVGFDALVPQIVAALKEVLAETPDEVSLVLENNAGSGQNIGARFSELGRLLQELHGDPRVRICLDTAHTFAAGYPVTTPEGLAATMEEFDRELGLDRLVAVHANDSKVPFGANVDRHENIGHGHIGREGFAVIMGHPAFANVPFLLEVPGFTNQGPDKPNVDVLKEIRASVRGD